MNLFQKELAIKIDLIQTAISHYELGKRNISKNLLKSLCEVLNLGFEDFVNNYTEFPKSFVLPKVLNENFAQFLGYFIGDGSAEGNRITFFEQRKDLALYYKKLIDNLFNTDCKYKFRIS
jgi:transcriptional regulator with XRE-family HTH domain